MAIFHQDAFFWRLINLTLTPAGLLAPLARSQFL